MRIPLRLLVLLLLCIFLLPACTLKTEYAPIPEIVVPREGQAPDSDTRQAHEDSAAEKEQAREQGDSAPEVPQPREDPVSAALRQGLEGAEPEVAFGVDSCRYSSWPVLPRLYERRGYRPVWTSPEAVDQLIAAIRASYDEGLNPWDYNLDEILESLEENPVGQASDPARAAFLDLLLTDAFIRLASNTLYGKEDPAFHHPEWTTEDATGSEALVDYFERALAFPSVTQIVDSWKVRYVYYERMKQALAAYRSIRARGGWKRLPEGKPLRMGDSGSGVLALRRRLAAEYPGLKLPLTNPLFDDGLSRAVRYFQARHSIRPDGVAGRETIMAMNVPVKDRIDQIRINLERCRWVLRNLGDLFVLVDIVGFNVCVQKDGKVMWSGRAQVGQPYRDTPLLRSEITHIELNPTWTIPPTVRDEDVLPEVKKDLNYLKKHNIVIIDKEGLGFVTEPKEVKWWLYPEEPFPYRLVQQPGGNNPLGRIKIMFPNKQRVFLHDTPSKFLFDRGERTFSSGCIRVERPFELASLLFRGFCEWTPGKLQRAANSSRTWTLDLPMPVPILITYLTVVVDGKGVPSFRKDLYSHDPSLLKELGPDPRIDPGSRRQRPEAISRTFPDERLAKVFKGLSLGAESGTIDADDDDRQEMKPGNGLEAMTGAPFE
ncbi:MAG TPA: L,D-transpeptidase family protein [Deltaproteobacteria bacterium]|nr:L,D-transpeptidase family protein [Deltaproteobacteria bacterium]